MKRTIKNRAPMMMPLEKRLMLDASLPVIAGQVLWLDADDASTIRDADGDNAATGTGGANNGFSGTVRTWVDKSGSGFNVTNNTAAQQPTYNATGLNGNGVISFDGTNDKLTNGAAAIAGDDVTMFIVYNRNIAAGRDGIFELGNGASRNAVFINDSANKVGYYANGTFYNSSAVYASPTYEIFTAIHDVNSINMWRNGVNQLSATGVLRNNTTGIYVGDDSSGGDELNGHIAEIIVYNRDLTADERRDVENYLASKWGLTITTATPVINTNSGATVSQSDPVTITSAMLSSSDTDNSESILRYTITDPTDYGTLTNTNTAHTYIMGEYFTQADIDNGYIRYTHGGTSNFTDAFSFTVTDQYAVTSAATFNLTITPDNVAPDFQGWTLVASENFEGGATGWSDNTTETMNPYLTRFLGRHSNEGGAQLTHKTYTLSGTQEYAILVFDFYRLDTWDSEQFRVFIDDVQVMNPSFGTGYVTIPDGSLGNVSWTVQELTPFAANMGGGTSTDQAMRITLRIDTTASSVKVGFGSTTNQAIADEAWGVDNLNLYEVDAGGTPGAFHISEGQADGTIVGTLTAYDPDVADTKTYTITGGTGAGIFSLDPVTGIITLTDTASVNYEVTTSYTLNVRVTDNGVPAAFDDTIITINVLDRPENTAPVVAALGPISVAENAANGTVLGTMSATDAESNTISWSITGGNTDNIFAINSSTGAIRINNNANMNYEWDNSYTLMIAARDNGFGTLTGTRNVVVNLTDINEAPTFDIPQSFLNQNPYLRYDATTGNFYRYISTTRTYAAATTAAAASLLNGVAGHIATIGSAAENAYVRSLGAGSIWLGGTDSVTEGSWVWGGSGPEGGQIFSIGSMVQGTFYTNWQSGQPDNGGGTSDNLEMLASGLWTDVNGGNRAYVIEWEGADVMAALGNGPYTLAENPVLNQSVGFVYARDADSGDTITYSITGGTGAANFAVNSATGEITVTNPSAINYESATSYTLDMRVEDVAGLFHTRTVTINITNVNETPVLNPGGPFSVTENAANNTLVGTMTASDPDAATTLTYSITSGDTRGIFTINNAGEIRVARTHYLDYELGSTYTINVRVSDGALTANRSVTINLTNVNEAPSFDAIQRVLNADPTLEYNATTGNFYRYVSTTANYATAENNAAAATINGVGGYVAAINSAAERTFVSTLTPTTIWINGSDAAVEGEWRYTSGPNAGQMFWLGTASGSAQNGNYTAWGGGEPNNSANEDAIEFTTGGNWNDTNVAGSRAYVIEWDGADVLASMQHGPYDIPEHSVVSFVPGTALANDPDAGNVLTYSITGGTGAGLFSIDASGIIRLTGPVNYELVNSYTLDLRVQDVAGLFDTMSINLSILDQNDIPGTLTLSANHVVENTALNTLIGDLSTFDEDPADTHIYSLVTNPGNKFVIVNGNEIRTFGAIDYEQNQSFSVIIRTSDGNGGILDRTFQITVGDQMDTFTPPPATGGPSGADIFIPSQDDQEDRKVDLLRSSFSGEQGQSAAFYGDSQIVRENVTFEIRNLLGEIHTELQLSDGMFIPRGVLEEEFDLFLQGDEEEADQADFTNLREALSFLQQMEDTRKTSNAETAETHDDATQRNLPANTIDRQFVDVMTYHKDRAARLREALLQDA